MKRSQQFNEQRCDLFHTEPSWFRLSRLLLYLNIADDILLLLVQRRYKTMIESKTWSHRVQKRKKWFNSIFVSLEIPTRPRSKWNPSAALKAIKSSVLQDRGQCCSTNIHRLKQVYQTNKNRRRIRGWRRKKAKHSKKESAENKQHRTAMCLSRLPLL